jgi:transposase-like protein
LQRRLTRQLKPTCDSWHVVETYIRIKGKRRYLYRGPKKGSVNGSVNKS